MAVPTNWKDKHKGERCFILASGISVNKIDLSKLDGELVIGVNKSYKGRIATYHCISDPAAMHYWSKELLEVAKQTNMVFSSPPCKKLTPGAHTVPLSYRQLHKGGVINKNLNLTHWGRSVVLDLALPLATYLGCRKVYLLGCDCSGSGHFYDLKPQSHVRYIIGPGVLENYNKFKVLFEKMGGAIHISTPASKLGMFSYVKFEDLFSEEDGGDTSKGRVEASAK